MGPKRGEKEGVGRESLLPPGHGSPASTLSRPCLHISLLKGGSSFLVKKKERGKGLPFWMLLLPQRGTNAGFLGGHDRVFRVKGKEKRGHRHVRSSLRPCVRVHECEEYASM